MSNRIDMTQSPNKRVVDLMGDLDFTLDDTLDPAEALQQIIEKCKNNLILPPGKYNVRILAVITSED